MPRSLSSLVAGVAVGPAVAAFVLAVPAAPAGGVGDGFTRGQPSPPPDTADAVSIARLHEDGNDDGEPDLLGDTVTVAGRAAIGSGVLHPERLDVPIQQEGRGVYLFDWSIPEAVEAGDSVIARGVLGSYRGRLQVQRPRYRVVSGPRRVPDPVELEINPRRLERREGALVEVEGELVRSTRNAGGRMLVLRGLAQPEQVVTVFLPWERLAEFDPDRFAEGDRLRVRGAVGQYDAQAPADAMYQIYPTGPDAVGSVGLTADVYRRMAWGGAGAVVIGFLIWGVMLKRQIRKRKEAQKRFESLFDENVAGVVALDVEGRITRSNTAFREIVGGAEDALRGAAFTSIVSGPARTEMQEHLEAALDGRSSHFESALADGDGRRIHVEVSTVPILVDDEPVGVYVIVEDITHRKEFEERLQHQALHDHLTGLPNRALFSDRLEHAVERAGRSGERIAVIFLDLDRFKRVNDSEGHAAGDRLLQRVAERMREVARDADTLARFGGDEFALLLEDLEDQREAVKVAGRVVETLEEPISLGGQSIRVSASVGLAVSADGKPGPREILQRADQAMYRAKAEGGGRLRLHEGDVSGDEAGGLRLENDLRDAVASDQLFLEYQPLVSLETGRMVGVEALVRWDHPRCGRLEPGSFVPMAERSGLIVDVDRWVLRRACEEIAAWQRRHPHPTPLVLSVNLSARHFDEPGFADEIAAVLDDAREHDGEVQLEITESAAARRVEEARRLTSLGVRLAVDDFGTGYSSLGYLRDLEVDAIKLDRSFVGKIDSDPASSAIARTVVTLGRALGVDIVAEGLETEAQLRALAGFGCELGQGFLLGEPCRIQELDARRVPGRVAEAVT